MTTENKSAAELAAEIKAAHEKALGEVKGIAEKALSEAHDHGQLLKSTSEKADEALLKLNGLSEQVSAAEQRLARVNGGGADEYKTVGQRFTESAEFQRLRDAPGQKGRANIDLKTSFELERKATLTLATSSSAGSVGDAVQAARVGEIMPLPQRRLTVRDLLTPGRMDGNTLEYVKETGFTNNAAPVAEAAAKPQSDIVLDVVSTTAKVIAHFMKASRQALDDVAQLRSIIDQRLLYGLAYVEESQLLNGSGSGQNLNGIVTQATAYSAPITLTSPTSIDLVRLAMLQASLAEYPATGIVMHPNDWTFIETMKDATGQYLIGNPQGGIAPTLWALPVVATQSMTVDKFLVGAFRQGAQIFDRWTARVELATENEDDFIKNLVTILAEERLALAVYRPEAFIYGDFGRV
jgi:HK97 family phage major capsid protein